MDVNEYFEDRVALEEAQSLPDETETEALEEIRVLVDAITIVQPESGAEILTDAQARDLMYRAFLAGRASMRDEDQPEGVTYVPMSNAAMGNLLALLLDKQ